MSDYCFSMMQTYAPSVAATKKMKTVPENFAFYAFAWLGDYPDMDVMKVTGCVFREAKRGKNKGQLSITVAGTVRHIYITSAEIQAADLVLKGKSNE